MSGLWRHMALAASLAKGATSEPDLYHCFLPSRWGVARDGTASLSVTVRGAETSAAAKRPGLRLRRLLSSLKSPHCVVAGVIRASQSCFDASDLASRAFLGPRPQTESRGWSSCCAPTTSPCRRSARRCCVRTSLLCKK